MPVRPLASPGLRTLGWLGLSLTFIGAVVYAMTPRADLLDAIGTPRFVLEQATALATAAAAAFAAFCASIPGRDRRIMALPLAPLAIWLGSVGLDCAVMIARRGWLSVRFEDDWLCIPAIALTGFGPAALIVLMLRRGAPLAPALTMALAGLAAAGLGSFGLRLFHAEDASLMVLVWQIGTVAVLSAVSGAIGPLVLSWRRLTDAAFPKSGHSALIRDYLP
jgi:hypothetical protein